jgi:hypothetical protein
MDSTWIHPRLSSDKPRVVAVPDRSRFASEAHIFSA